MNRNKLCPRRNMSEARDVYQIKTSTINIIESLQEICLKHENIFHEPSPQLKKKADSPRTNVVNNVNSFIQILS